MATEGDWIYTLDEELHERLRDLSPAGLAKMTTHEVNQILIAISLSRIALTLEDVRICIERGVCG